MICTGCEEDKPQSEFTGYRKSCNECQKERCRRYYRKNKAKRLAAMNEYRLAHREEARVKARAYYRRKTA